MRAVVAMSGGVDSSVCAALLKKEGHEVIGITMNVWDLDRCTADTAKGRSCCSPRDVDDARRVCEIIDIPFYPLNYRDIFRQKVYQPFVDEYIRGRTPNPCVRCNNDLKFSHLLDQARILKADILATGHYAILRKNEADGRFHLYRGIDKSKDQSYFLFGLTPETAEFVRFPLGGFDKSQVREMAMDFGLKNAEKRDSQDVCFVADGSYADLVAGDDRLASLPPGEIVDSNGRVLGPHQGYYRYTIGQRKGLGIAAAQPLFVTGLDPSTNRVIVGEMEDLYSREMRVIDLNLVAADKLEDGARVMCKIRYRSTAVAATLHRDKGKISNGSSLIVRFEEDQRAVTPGQAAVFYQDDEVLGGGWIEETVPNA